MKYLPFLLAGVALALAAAIRPSFCRVRRNIDAEALACLVPEPPRRWIVGGMMGSGKTTFASSLAATLRMQHVEIDRYTSEEEILEAVRAAEATGWVAEANPWQIPPALTERAEIIVFLDYDNVVNYGRLLKRGLAEWRAQRYAWCGFRRSVIDRAVLDLGRIVYRYGKANRDGWRRNGLLPGMEMSAARYVRCISPAELKRIEQLLRSRGRAV